LGVKDSHEKGSTGQLYALTEVSFLTNWLETHANEAKMILLIFSVFSEFLPSMG